jgi:hypothetical protein
VLIVRAQAFAAETAGEDKCPNRACSACMEISPSFVAAPQRLLAAWGYTARAPIIGAIRPLWA